MAAEVQEMELQKYNKRRNRDDDDDDESVYSKSQVVQFGQQQPGQTEQTPVVKQEDVSTAITTVAAAPRTVATGELQRGNAPSRAAVAPQVPTTVVLYQQARKEVQTKSRIYVNVTSNWLHGQFAQNKEANQNTPALNKYERAYLFWKSLMEGSSDLALSRSADDNKVHVRIPVWVQLENKILRTDVGESAELSNPFSQYAVSKRLEGYSFTPQLVIQASQAPVLLHGIRKGKDLKRDFTTVAFGSRLHRAIVKRLIDSGADKAGKFVQDFLDVSLQGLNIGQGSVEALNGLAFDEYAKKVYDEVLKDKTNESMGDIGAANYLADITGESYPQVSARMKTADDGVVLKKSFLAKNAKGQYMEEVTQDVSGKLINLAQRDPTTGAYKCDGVKMSNNKYAQFGALPGYMRLQRRLDKKTNQEVHVCVPDVTINTLDTLLAVHSVAPPNVIVLKPFEVQKHSLKPGMFIRIKFGNNDVYTKITKVEEDKIAVESTGSGGEAQQVSIWNVSNIHKLSSRAGMTFNEYTQYLLEHPDILNKAFQVGDKLRDSKNTYGMLAKSKNLQSLADLLTGGDVEQGDGDVHMSASAISSVPSPESSLVPQAQFAASVEQVEELPEPLLAIAEQPMVGNQPSPQVQAQVGGGQISALAEQIAQIPQAPLAITAPVQPVAAEVPTLQPNYDPITFFDQVKAYLPLLPRLNDETKKLLHDDIVTAIVRSMTTDTNAAFQNKQDYETRIPQVLDAIKSLMNSSLFNNDERKTIATTLNAMKVSAEKVVKKSGKANWNAAFNNFKDALKLLLNYEAAAKFGGGSAMGDEWYGASLGGAAWEEYDEEEYAYPEYL